MTLPPGFVTAPGLDPAEDHIGPFYHRRDASGLTFAFEPAARHCNTNNTVHGGVLMTFADHCLWTVAMDGFEAEACVTVSFTADFVSAAGLGDWVSGTAEVVRRTGSMVFVRGELASAGQTVLTFSAVTRRLKPRD